MEITSKQVLKILYILSWMIFIGVCINACGFIFSTIYTFTINPANVHSFWQGTDLSYLYNFDKGHFLVMTSFMIITSVLKAVLFSLIVKILHYKKFDFAQPFNNDVKRLIFNLSYLAFAIGFFSSYASNYTQWLVKQGVTMPDLQLMHLGGNDVWMFMGVILFVIAHIFKRGIEIQTENELTV